MSSSNNKPIITITKLYDFFHLWNGNLVLLHQCTLGAILYNIMSPVTMAVFLERILFFPPGVKIWFLYNFISKTSGKINRTDLSTWDYLVNCCFIVLWAFKSCTQLAFAEVCFYLSDQVRGEAAKMTLLFVMVVLTILASGKGYK